MRIDNSLVSGSEWITANSESAGINRHVVGVKVPAGKEVANPS